MLEVHRFNCNHRIRRMRFLSHYLLRGFIFLLLTVFIANTVYASGMMAAGQLHALADSKAVQCHIVSSAAAEHHCHRQLASDEASQRQHQHHHKNSCNDCNHCFACFSVIIPSHFNYISTPDQAISAIPFAEIYLSPASAQLQKPPIV